MKTYREFVQKVADKAASVSLLVFERRTLDPKELHRLNIMMIRGVSPQFVSAYREGQRLAVEIKKKVGMIAASITAPSGVIVNGLIDLAQREIDIEIDYMVARVTIHVQRMQHLGMSADRIGEVLQQKVADRYWQAFLNRVRRVIDNAIHSTADIGYYDGLR